VTAEVVCPYCRGRQVRQITPSEFECVTPHPAGLAPLGPGGPMRPCTHRFQVATATKTVPCACGRESIGQCKDCGKSFCGLHATGGGEFLCAACQRARQEQRFVREAEEERDRESGLVAFQGAKVSFARLWDLATQAMLALNPPADVMVVDARRSAELPERWPRRGGERKRRRAEAKWTEAADGLAIPAWAMEANFSRGSGVADTYSRSEIPLYLGGNAMLYVGAGSQTPGGTYTGGATHHTPDSVPEVWHEKWGAWGTIDNRQEVASGFANLATKHSLTIDL
jgi:hypothetical protein